MIGSLLVATLQLGESFVAVQNRPARGTCSHADMQLTFGTAGCRAREFLRKAAKAPFS